MYVRCPLSLRNVEDLLHERGIDLSHETVRYWWNRFGLMFASEIRRKRVHQLRAYSKWKWHADEVFFVINGKGHYLCHPGAGPNRTVAVDGVAGLMLQLTPQSGKSWLLRTRVGAKSREFGLGGYPEVMLAMAREHAREIEAQIPVRERIG